MQNTQYRIAVITNVTGQAMEDMTGYARAHSIVFDQVSFSGIELTGFRNSDFVKTLKKYDIVYYRTGLKGAQVETLAELLREKGIPLINGPRKHAFLHLKTKQALIADKSGIEQPRSYVVKNFDYECAQKLLGDRFVIKPDDGSRGNGVSLITNAKELQEYKKAAEGKLFLYQEYLENADEYRVYTLGNRAVTLYKKVRGHGEFRANLHTGGTIIPAETELEPLLKTFAERVAICFGSDIAGIDLLVHGGRPFFLEINFQPGWESVRETTGDNICKETIQYILDRAHDFAEAKAVVLT